MTWGAFLASHGWQLVLIAVLLGCSGFFSGSETALFTLSRRQLHRFASSGAAGRLVASLMSRPRRVLNALLLGNMLVNVAYTGIWAVMVLELQDSGAAPWAGALASVAPLVLLILLGEVAPKAVAFALGERWALLAAAPVTVLQRVLGPVLRVFEAALVAPVAALLAPRRQAGAEMTVEELTALLDLSSRRGILSRDVHSLLREIVELTDLRVRDIMVPRVDVIAYDVNDPREGLIEMFRRTRLRRIPLYDGDMDHLLGVVQAKRVLLNPRAPLRELIVRIPFVPEAAKLERLLLQFRVTRTQMAAVVDEYGGIAGVVTLHDVVEEIVGEIPDLAEVAPAPAVRRIDDRRYVLDGELGIHEWADAFKMDLSGGRISTIGGFVTSLLGHIPHVGETAQYRNLRFTVESMRKRRIETLRLDLLEDAP